MLKKPGPIAETEMKSEFKEMYKEIGFEGSLQVLYEMVLAATWLEEIMLEMQKKENQ